MTLQDHVIKESYDFKKTKWSKGYVTLYGQEPIKKSHHPAKFGVHRHCGSGDITILVCHVILQDHMIKESCDFRGRSPSR